MLGAFLHLSLKITLFPFNLRSRRSPSRESSRESSVSRPSKYNYTNMKAAYRSRRGTFFFFPQEQATVVYQMRIFFFFLTRITFAELFEPSDIIVSKLPAPSSSTRSRRVNMFSEFFEDESTSSASSSSSSTCDEDLELEVIKLISGSFLFFLFFSIIECIM
jgi:hypothetical protein